MLSALKAGAAYFLLVFAAGFALGTLRTLVLAPMIGDLGAVVLELPLMLAISWLSCGWVLRRIPVPKRADHRIAMGAFAFILLMAAEVLVSTQLGGLDLAGHLSLCRSLPVIIGLLGQIAFAVFPALQTEDQESTA